MKHRKSEWIGMQRCFQLGCAALDEIGWDLHTEDSRDMKTKEGFQVVKYARSVDEEHRAAYVSFVLTIATLPLRLWFTLLRGRNCHSAEMVWNISVACPACAETGSKVRYKVRLTSACSLSRFQVCPRVCRIVRDEFGWSAKSAHKTL